MEFDKNRSSQDELAPDKENAAETSEKSDNTEKPLNGDDKIFAKKGVKAGLIAFGTILAVDIVIMIIYFALRSK